MMIRRLGNNKKVVKGRKEEDEEERQMGKNENQMEVGETRQERAGVGMKNNDGEQDK